MPFFEHYDILPEEVETELLTARDVGELLLSWAITNYMTSLKNSPLYHRDSHVSPIHDQPLRP